MPKCQYTAVKWLSGCDLKHYFNAGIGITIAFLVLLLSISSVQAASLNIDGTTAELYGNLTYDYVNITNGGILYIDNYNGTSGTGTLNLTVVYDVNVDLTSSINGASRGYRGGAGAGGTTGPGLGGEVAGAGGGSDGTASGGGGGGGYGIAGGAGGGSSGGGTGGSTKGTTSGWDITMGSGAGGGGRYQTDTGTDGNPGGAMLRINAGRNISINGTLTFNGGTGGNGNGGTVPGGGGGASGGGILLNATHINISSATINLAGGNGGTSGTPAAGAGGGGRLKVFYLGTLTNTSTTVTTGTAYYEDTNASPTAPTLTNPTNNSIGYEVTTVNMTWSASSDTDSIGYTYQISNNSAFTDLVASGYTTNLYSGTQTIYATIQQFFRVGANDSYHTTWSPTVSIRDLALSAPANNSIQYFNYPPMTTEFSFTWSATESSVVYYNLIIAKDINFNLISSDTTFIGINKTISLDAGTYWYKVRPYYTDTGTYGAYTSAWTFSLIGNISVPSGTGIHGIVYESLSGVMTPINGATVYIYNTTWSSLQATGTNGYFLFSGLGTDTYTLYAVKSDYETSAISYVTPILNNTTANNILMKRYISPYGPNFVYETIQIKNIFGTAYVGSTVTLYEGDGLIAYLSGTTDSMGQVVFRVIKDQRYRITVSGGGISGTLTYYIYGKEDIYSITVVAGFPTGGDRYNDISANLTVQAFNSTHKNMTLVYLDSDGGTSQIWFYATNLSNGDKCTQSSTADSVTLSCTVLASGYYEYGYNATSTKYGYFKESKVHNFGAGTPDSPLVATGVDKTLLQWASIIILVVLASLFSITTVKYGAVIIPMVGMVLWVLGWFEPAPDNAAGSFIILSTAIILGVLVYMRLSETKAAY